MYAYLNDARDVLAVSTEERSLVQAQEKIPTVTARIDAAPDGLKPKGYCSATDVEYHRLKEGAGGQSLADYDLLEDVTALQAYRVAQVTVANDALFAKGALHDGKRFAIAPANKADWLALLVAKDSLSYPHQVYTINPPAPYLLADANAVVALVMGVLFPRCAWIYATGQAIDDAVMAATTKAEIDAIVDDRE